MSLAPRRVMFCAYYNAKGEVITREIRATAQGWHEVGENMFSDPELQAHRVVRIDVTFQ